MSIDSVVFFKIMDPKLYVYGVENPLVAIENLAATTLRNIIGDLGWTPRSCRATASASSSIHPGRGHRRVRRSGGAAWWNITPPAAIPGRLESGR